MIALLLGAALANELPPVPDPPVRAADEPADCEAKAAAPAGASRECDAVSVPPAYLAFLEQHREYSDQLRLHLAAVRAVRAADRRTATEQIGHLEYLIEQPRPIRTWEAAALIGTGAAMVLAGGWAVGQAAPH